MCNQKHEISQVEQSGRELLRVGVYYGQLAVDVRKE